MADYKQDYINYRLAAAEKALADAQLLADSGSWNTAVNRLYYASFYAVSALLLQYNINAQTHAGTKSQFGLHFVKSGKISLQQGRLYADLMDWRQKGDYGDMFDFEGENVLPLFEPVKELLAAIKMLIEQ